VILLTKILLVILFSILLGVSIPSSEASHRSTDVSIHFAVDTCCVVGEIPRVIIEDSEANKDPSSKDSIVFTAYSKSNPQPVKFNAREMLGRNSPLFTGIIPINDITTKVGDTLIVSYSYQSHGQTFTILESKEIRESKETSTKPLLVYVQPLPEWASYANGAVARAIDFWEKNQNVKFELVSEEKGGIILIKWVKDFGFDRAGHAYNQKYVEVGLGDSYCWSQWNPYHPDYIANIMTHEFGHVLGYLHEPQPYPIMDIYRDDKQYGPSEIEGRLSSGSNWFIPLCSINEQTTFDYHIVTDDPNYGFNVEFVPSKEEYDKKRNRENYLSFEECSSWDVKEVKGRCDVTKETGVVITVGELTKSISEITSTYEENKIQSGSRIFSEEPANIESEYSSSSSGTVFDSFKRTYELGLDARIPPVGSVEIQVNQKQNNFQVMIFSEEDNTSNDADVIFAEYYSGTGVPQKFGLQETGSDTGIFEQVIGLKEEYLKNPITVVYKGVTETGTVQDNVYEKPITVCGPGTVVADGVCVVEEYNEYDSGGGCLIATATFGSEMAPQVQQLRELRDNHLLNTESGTNFMNSFNDFYYSFSPYIADYERENPLFKEVVKLAITPMLSSLSIFNHVDMDSEVKVLGYGISLIFLNIGMYFAAPAIVITAIKRKFL